MDRRSKNDTAYDVVPILYDHGMIEEPVGRKVHCPYHPDAIASASINEDQTLFYCHVCGIGGDAIALIRSHDGADYPTAVNKAQELSSSVHQPVRRTTGRRRGLFG